LRQQSQQNTVLGVFCLKRRPAKAGDTGDYSDTVAGLRRKYVG
jgi:hypothetical protein